MRKLKQYIIDGYKYKPTLVNAEGFPYYDIGNDRYLENLYNVIQEWVDEENQSMPMEPTYSDIFAETFLGEWMFDDNFVDWFRVNDFSEGKVYSDVPPLNIALVVIPKFDVASTDDLVPSSFLKDFRLKGSAETMNALKEIEIGDVGDFWRDEIESLVMLRKDTKFEYIQRGLHALKNKPCPWLNEFIDLTADDDDQISTAGYYLHRRSRALEFEEFMIGAINRAIPGARRYADSLSSILKDFELKVVLLPRE